MTRRGFLAVVLLVGALTGGVARAQDDAARLPLTNAQERVVAVPVDLTAGVRLVVTFFGPQGKGPFPLAVILHEATGRPGESPRFGLNYLTSYFLSRGYMVAQPMMRGFAGSGGQPYAQGCDLAGTARANARDVAAMIEVMSHADGIDTQHSVIVGTGFGGWNALPLAQTPPPGVRAMATFLPAIATSFCPPAIAGPALADGARAFGAGTTVPVLWVAGTGPGVNPPDAPILAGYRAGGAAPDVLDIGNFMGNAAALLRYPEGLRLWVPRMDALLRRAGLPAEELSAGYLPVVPAATGYAKIDDVSAVPWLNEASRATFAGYQHMPMPRVFVVGADGMGTFSLGGYDVLRNALASCAAAGKFCMPYAYDNDVIWPVVTTVATHYAAVGDVAKVPYVADRGRADYRAFLAWPLPRAFAVAPEGWTSAQGAYAPVSALAQCRARFHDCALYAVDDAVVWRAPE